MQDLRRGSQDCFRAVRPTSHRTAHRDSGWSKWGQLRGIIVIEVDDLLCFGDEGHDVKLEELRGRFNFGKFVDLA